MLRDFHRTTISVSRRWKSILAGILAILCIYFNRSSQYFKPSKLTESIINEGRDMSSEQDLGIVHNAGSNNGEFYRFFPVSDSQGFEDSPSLARHGLHTVWHSSANLNPSDSSEALSASSDTTADVGRPSLAGEYHFFQVDQHAAPTLSATTRKIQLSSLSCATRTSPRGRTYFPFPAVAGGGCPVLTQNILFFTDHEHCSLRYFPSLGEEPL